MESSLPTATISFLPNWCQHQEGAITLGGRLIIEYFPMRLEQLRRATRDWTPFITAYVRFHPSGLLHTQTINILHGDYQKEPSYLEVPVPLDSTKVEVWWVHPELGSGTWDSRCGQNYWFNVGLKWEDSSFTISEPVPEYSFSYRAGAIPNLEMVNVFEETPPQTIQDYIGGHTGPLGSALCTRLFVKSWVKNIAYLKHVWLDIYTFGFKEELLSAKPHIMRYLEPAGGNGDFFVLDDKIYVPGAPGSGHWDRKVHYRLYFEANSTVYTDGILHEHDIQKPQY
ncbi:MAG TPA: DUF6209 family protein [Pyrinomonadaceae bacterium]